ncbi:MAG: aldolase/citrate lyase family protein [Planctomycetota bacterium]|jgi:2-keto-3-deoxy-L-rhamnonate aldolase RhmA
MIKRTMLALVLCLLVTQLGAKSNDSKTLSLNQRLHNGENLKNVRVPTDASREDVHALIRATKPDILYLDAHHHPCTEWDISRICKAAMELDVPVLMRIDHADQASMISSMLDLGLFGIKVPTVEDEETVQKIIDGFYYPPIGKRSLGASVAFGKEIARKEGKPYYQWWNDNAILGCKIETVKGVLNVRYLAKPGIDFFDFGGQDLSHDLMILKHPGFETIEDCRKFVKMALQGKDVHF